MPFRKGDIVQVSDPLDRRIFVLDFLCTDDRELTERLLCSGDQMDMTAHGYWIDRMVQRCYGIPGSLSYNCMHYYPDLEYYTGPFQGEYRTLLALSRFIKGKIELPLFLDSYSFILQEEALQWKYKRLELGWTQEGLSLAGLE